ncbi:hypothetical protein QTJ16_004277 [Diplocarpon rosae]|uniref:Uncharacterized protein n=1 Tax=Diplocarpon rosae TaxID=946125 RepID=A0AAD9T0H4_9HELO|nr:hypothetical protein QTJ16_004277 [Diplocarpon rosae]
MTTTKLSLSQSLSGSRNTCRLEISRPTLQPMGASRNLVLKTPASFYNTQIFSLSCWINAMLIQTPAGPLFSGRSTKTVLAVTPVGGGNIENPYL